MRKHAKSENRKVSRKPRDRESEEIGSSRVFPTRGPAVSMPSVGTRSSTRVFVPKNISKRLALSKPVGKKAASDGDGDADDWAIMEREDANWWKGGKGSAENHREEQGRGVKVRWRASEERKLKADYQGKEIPTYVLNENAGSSSLQEKSYGIFYSRKRRRLQSFGQDSASSVSPVKDAKDGLTLLSDGSIPLSTELGDRDSSGSRYGVFFLPKSEFPEKGIVTSKTARGFARNLGISGRDPWLGSVGNMVLVIHRQLTINANSYQFTSLILSLLTGMTKKNVSLFECAAFLSSRAVARVFSSHGIDFLPVRGWKSEFSDKSAVADAGVCIIFGVRQLIPLVSVNFSALPLFFTRLHLGLFVSSLRMSSALATADVEVSVEERRLRISNIHEEALRFREAICFERHARQESVAVTGSPETPSIISVPVVSDVRFQKHQRRSSKRYRRKSSVDRQNGIMRMDTDSKVHSIHDNYVVVPVHQKRRKGTSRNSIQVIKELKSALSEAEQNVGMLSCTANILVIESDRCWREEGAKVMLELSSSNKWCLAVKLGDTTRYVHKAQEVKPSATNRYTHAMMWAAETGWKLEFCDKKDWNVFKELHRECFERNMQGLPVPGYEESFTSSFSRPDSYIRMVDEVERLLRSENACYDMDSGDEEWLEQMNSKSLSNNPETSVPISLEDFEKIISAFEKAAYSHPEGALGPEKAADLCPNLGSRDMVVSAFDYWTKKRKQRRSALVRFFQIFRRDSQSPGSRRKSKQSNQFCRSAARSAQLLMTNADWATFKAVMASRLAEAARASESPDLPSSILG
ncbi:unnamed protein product [Spirodela intermedia]|uniref:Enhancer of polycomb-like protein n=1 Tax=Spirodela intermedia TaxID=51605 RepID=A0A7I8IG04_SPIIN|nr:unnamed protein product [Spirodela intermedia]CAA6656214.1 unnamed protein product [Spirodela intermedia]